MNKLRTRLQAYKGIIAVMGILLVAGLAVAGVKAYQGNAPTTVIENGTITINNPAPDAPVNLGASPGPDMYVPYLSVNGVQSYYEQKGLNAASTTICSLLSPNATSTLELGSIGLRTSTTTAFTLTLAKATTANATTTLLGEISGAANTKVTLVASSTIVSLEDRVFAPNTYFNATMRGGAPAATAAGTITGYGQYSPTGRCQAKFTITE